MTTTNKGGINMKYVYRMMSQLEYDNLIAGKQLVNETIHDPDHTFSYSTGFCFLPWTVEYTDDSGLVGKMTALQAIDRIMPGVSRYDLWVQLRVLNPKVLKKSLGCYLDTKTSGEVWSNELCTTSYSARDLQPTHAFKIEKIEDVLWARFMAGSDYDD